MPGLGSRGAALRPKLDLPSVPDASGMEPLRYKFVTNEMTDVCLKVVG